VIERLNAELATAQEAKALQGRIDEVSLRLSKMDAADALKSVDPQAEALAKIVALSPDTVRTGLAILIAALIELGSGLGFWLLMSPNEAEKKEPTKVEKRKRETARKTEAQTSAPERAPEVRIVDQWAGETVVRRKDNFVLAAEIRASFDAWCRNNDLTPVNATLFGRRMTSLNFKRKKVGGSIRYDGVVLRRGARPELTVIDGAIGTRGNRWTG
jgi:hypothetical protein